MNNPQVSESPPSYTAAREQAPPPVAGGVQMAYGSASQPQQQHQQEAAVPVIYNTGALQPITYALSKRIYENYHGRQSIRLGVTMILCGVLCVIFNIVTILQITDHTSIIGYGIWSGVMFIITGIFGVVVEKKKTMCKIIAFMVLCISSSALCLILFTFSAAGASNVHYSYPCYLYHRNFDYDMFDKKSTPTPEFPSACMTAKAMEAMIACLSVIMTICTIWGSVLCCKVVCCCAGTGQQVMLPLQYIPVQSSQQVVLYPVQQDTSTGFIIGSDIPSASGGSYNTPSNFPYNPHQYGQGPPIYNDHKVPL